MYMKRCFRLSLNGLGHTRPNPLVGCVVVNGGRVVSEGYHAFHGGNHAERDAILRCRDKSLLRGATLYVNLEPCSHFGLTPPCADLIVESGVSRVVCCNDDPNPLVAGRGFAKLEAAGIEVVRHVLEDEGRELNRRFFTFMEKHRPYIILKWAQTADGYMDVDRSDGLEHKYWISNGFQTILSHKWRTEEAAILVGSSTYINDCPQLTARFFDGQQPQPVVWDRRGRIHNLPSHWLRLQCATVAEAMDVLYTRKIQSVIVEGGRQILDSFISSGIYDEVRILQSDRLFGEGLRAPDVPLVASNHLTIVR